MESESVLEYMVNRVISSECQLDHSIVMIVKKEEEE